VIPHGLQVLEALAWWERTAASTAFPLRKIATTALGGNDALAATVLAELALEGCVGTDTMGWYTGWLTPKGRAVAMTDYAA